MITEPEIEPDELEIEPEPELEIEPMPPMDGAQTPTASAALMQVLPADFPLPLLTRFVPDLKLRVAAEEAARYAIAVDVAGPEGLQRADVAVTAVRASLKAIEEHFEEPVALANRLHKHLTGVRGEWLERGAAAVRLVGSRIAAEKNRLDAIERERDGREQTANQARRKAQAEADQIARELARKEADAAAKAKAPAPVVEQLRQRAETATAPPVPVSEPAPKLQGSSVVSTWKARIAGTPAVDDPLPDTELLSPAQHVEVLKLLKAILDGRAPICAVSLNASYLNKRAKADKSTLAIPGIEAFEEGTIRAKATRTK